MFFKLFGGEKKEKDERKTEKKKKISTTIYYKLYRQTRYRFFPQLAEYKYTQVLDWINNNYFPKLLKVKDLSLNSLFSVYPIPLVFITPRKKAITLFSIYNGAIAEEVYHHDPPAKYEEMGQYIDVDPVDIRLYVKGRLLIYKTITPFRIVAGLPVRVGKKVRENVKIIDDSSMNVIKDYTTPSSLFREIFKLAKNAGVEAAVRFTYSLVHISDNLSTIIKKNKDPVKIQDLIQYLQARKEQLLYGKEISKPREEASDKILPSTSLQKETSPHNTLTDRKLTFCPNCGARIPPNAKYCPNCGYKIR